MHRSIIVKGNPNVGKSDILIEIYEILENIYGKRPPLDPKVWNKDKYGIFKTDHLTIGICTAGDDIEGVIWFMNKCFEHDCNLIIGPCRNVDLHMM